MMEPFASPAAWFLWWNTHHPQKPLWKGLDKASVKWFSIKVKIKQEIYLFLVASLSMPTIACSALAMVAKMASIAVSGLP
jgi:hypothetical protein